MLQFSAVLNSAFTVSQRSHIFYCYSNTFGVAQHYFIFIKNPTLSIPVHEGGKFWSFSHHALGQNSGRNVGIWKVTLTNCTELLVWVKNIPKLSQMRRLDPEHNSRLGRLTAWVDEGGWGVRGIIICLKWLRHTR